MPAYKDKNNNTWYCQFYYKHIDGKNHKKFKRGFNTKKEALEYEREFLLLKQGDNSMIFGDFLELYIRDVSPTYRDRTKITKQSRHKRILKDFKDIPLNEIKPIDIVNWQNSLINEGLKTQYINNIKTEFSTILNHAVRYYGLKNNPIHKTSKVKNPNEVPEDMRYWTLQEFKEVYKNIEDIKGKTAINLLYWTGIRKGELLALTREKIDFNNKTVLINRSLQRIKGKSVVTGTKTYEQRIISLPDNTIKQLELYKNKCYATNKEDFVFMWEKRFLENAISKGTKKANEEIKKYNRINGDNKKPLIKVIHIHGLRHSHASYLIHNNINIVYISKRLGHKKTSITLDTYSHFYPISDDDLIEKMNNDF